MFICVLRMYYAKVNTDHQMSEEGMLQPVFKEASDIYFTKL